MSGRRERERSIGFLAAWDLTLEELAGHVEVPPTGTVLLAGSIPAGLATEDSDIDLLAIGGGSVGHAGVVHDSNCVVSSRRFRKTLKLNIEVWPQHQVDAVRDRFLTCVDMLTGPSSTDTLVTLNASELRVLHRLRTGVPIVNPERCEEIREEFSIRYLPLQRIASTLANAYNAREDAIAQLRIGEPISALWMLRLAVHYLAQAVLASFGETAPSPKWIPRLLDGHRDDLGDEVVDDFIRFLFPEAGCDADQLMREALDFADRVVKETVRSTPEIHSLMRYMIERFQTRASID